MLRERVRRSLLPPAKENVEKLAKVVEDGNCYGAQQMYKSISARYISAERYSEALDLLHSGACLQLEHGQVTCGAELSVLFVETLVKGKFPYDDVTLDRVRKILKKFPQIPVPQHLDLTDDDDMQKLSEALGEAKIRVEGCSSFLKAAIKWSAEFGAHRNGSLELHDMLAEYIYSESPEVCYPGEDDLAIARAILMYLSLGNLRDANYLMDELKNQVRDKELNLPRSDLMQFINYLLLTLQRDALPLFNVLTQTYKSAIDREPVFYELLEEIAGIFYGVQRRNPMQGMFGDFFKMMGGDGM
ncbi:Golgi to ER traffic protein 4 homolog isoform X3 [Camellia sinensis]|uniref:Golgi to ER traffic protein 4 homolog isoform X3 n=1 Tax=Camellia sinensis TaxID=4442 RepID=UPI001036C5E5|nr:Golgi to ER traffic protein 4 homolog isoform X3 [Camellia sinensis]